MSKTKQVSKHMQHYLPLLGIIAAGGRGLVVFSYDKSFQAAVALSVAISYFIWGLVHHHLHRDLHLATVLEYLAIAVLGIVVLFSLLFRA